MVPVTKLRQTRRGVEVTVKVTPAKRGHQPYANVNGRVRDGALVTSNGMRWVFR